MLEIKPIQTTEEQQDICEQCDLPFRTNTFAYKAINDGTLFAVSQFDIGGTEATVYGEKQIIGQPDDYEALFILGRGVLNFLDLCGVKHVVFRTENEHDEKLARVIGYRRGEDGIYRISLEGLFTNPCEHGNAYPDTTKNT